MSKLSLICHIADLVVFMWLTQTNPKAPPLHKVVEPEEIISKTGLAYPHTRVQESKKKAIHIYSEWTSSHQQIEAATN